MSQELLSFEVPRVSVDFLADDLTGRQKLTVLGYLSLDDTITQIGLQRFGKTTIENISFQDIRDWFLENWGEEFAYDLNQRNIPISFRASLALELFRTKIIKYLEKLGEVEIYASREVQEIFKRGQENI